MKFKLLVLLLAGLLLAGCDDDYEDYEEYEETSYEEEADEWDDGEQDAEVQASEDAVAFTTDSLDGQSVDSLELFGKSKLTMVNVWGTFCNSCISEMPTLGEISAEHDPSDLQVVGVIYDVYQGDSKNRIGVAQTLVEDTGADYLHLLLNEDMLDLFVSQSNIVPTTYFFNQQGEIIDSVTGAYSKEDWESIIESVSQK